MGKTALRLPTAIIAAAVILGTSAIAATSIAAGGSQVSICANRATGALRLLKSGACKKTETLVRVGVRGPQGLPGPQGAAGPVGPAGPAGPAGDSSVVLDANGRIVGSAVGVEMYLQSDPEFADYGSFTFNTLNDGLWWRVSQSGQVWGAVGPQFVPEDQVFYLTDNCTGAPYIGDVALTGYLLDSTAEWVNELGDGRVGWRFKIRNDWWRFTAANPVDLGESGAFSVKQQNVCRKRADLPETLTGDVPTGFPTTLYPIAAATEPLKPVLEGPLQLKTD